MLPYLMFILASKSTHPVSLVLSSQNAQCFYIMDRLPYRQKILNDRNSKICYHSLKDHPKVSKIAKFRCEML